MNNNDQPITDQPVTEEENPLLFWAAYQEGTDGHKHYLGNGSGGVRLFKKRYGEGGIEEYLDQFISAEHRTNVNVHQVQGKITVPVAPDQALPEDLENLAKLPPITPNLFGGRLDIQPLPISNLPKGNILPSAVEALHDIEQKRKRRRRR